MIPGKFRRFLAHAAHSHFCLIYSLECHSEPEKQHVAHSYVANCDDSVCNTDETAACHSDLRFASDGSQHRLCTASAVVNQANGSQKVVF